MSKAVEQSIKQKLKNISRELNIPFNSLLEKLFLERFLARVSKSKQADKFIFKGGLCLAQFLDLGRETKDIDFLLTQAKIHSETIKNIMEETAAIDMGDHFIFRQAEVSLLPIQHTGRAGCHVSVQGHLGQIKNKISIDISAGDVTDSKLLEIQLIKSKQPLFEKSVCLNSYTPEYIFSEKAEAVLSLGAANSRMKDFYDCFRLIKSNILNDKLLKTAIQKTMQNRKTELRMIPKPDSRLESGWRRFLKKNKISSFNLDSVVSEINQLFKSKLLR